MTVSIANLKMRINKRIAASQKASPRKIQQIILSQKEIDSILQPMRIHITQEIIDSSERKNGRKCMAKEAIRAYAKKHKLNLTNIIVENGIIAFSMPEFRVRFGFEMGRVNKMLLSYIIKYDAGIDPKPFSFTIGPKQWPTVSPMRSEQKIKQGKKFNVARVNKTKIKEALAGTGPVVVHDRNTRGGHERITIQTKQPIRGNRHCRQFAGMCLNPKNFDLLLDDAVEARYGSDVFKKMKALIQKNK